jgi:cyclopropane fatty-acyl-phospholipid synthase-like methyltransferase
LDIGCGCGLPATKLLSETFEVTGIDISAVQVERARRLVPSARFVCADIAEARFPEGAFAGVVSFYAIIHMPLQEHRELFRRIARWLRPEGILLAIIVHTAWTGTEEKYLGVEGGKMWWSHADEETTLQWVAEAGFRVLWKRFIPEEDSGHTLVLAQRMKVDGEV